MAKKHKILGAIAGLVGVAVIATGVYFAVPKIVNKSWGEILHIGEEKPPAEKSKLTLNTNGNLTFICADDKGNTYTEEELEAKEWQGETLTFTLAPNDGYMLWSTKVNGQEITLDNNMFTITMDQDTTIDVDVQELKEYTANIIEDSYSQWQLTVNGEPLNSGDTIRTGDLISGRVISLTSGYKTGTFLVNDVEYVQNLDKYGIIQEDIRIMNSENEEVRFSTSTVRDTSSNIISVNRLDTQGIINTPAYSYTSEICSVYYITSYGLRVGEEVKMDFTILNTELFGGITLNGESLEVTIAEDEVTASCTFIVPATECTLEVVSLFEKIISLNYDNSLINIVGLDEYSGNAVYDADTDTIKLNTATSRGRILIEVIDPTFFETQNLIISNNLGVESCVVSNSELSFNFYFPEVLEYNDDITDIFISFEDKVLYKTLHLDIDPGISFEPEYDQSFGFVFDLETNAVMLYADPERYESVCALNFYCTDSSLFDNNNLILSIGESFSHTYASLFDFVGNQGFSQQLLLGSYITADDFTLSLKWQAKEVEEPAFESYTINFDVDSDLTVRSVSSWQIVDGTMIITEQPDSDTFTIRVTCLGSHTGEDLVVTVNGEEHARETFELGQAYEFEIPYTAEDVSIYFEENNILPYQFNEGILVSYTGTSSDLVIPESYSVDDEGNFIVGDDILITEIKDYAFTPRVIDNLTSITIPNTITKIGNWAFSYCRNLTSITFPASVTQIGLNPFKGCEKLETVNIEPGNVNYKIENGCLIETYTNTLKSCLLGLNLQSLTIPDGISTIAREAFRGCGLTNITMPHSLRIIEREAFMECSNLQNIDIPNGVESIGSDAFIYCEKLISVTIPESVIQIDSTPFRYCKDLTNIIIDESNTSYKMENNCLIEIVSNTVLQGLNVSSITVPETIKRIGLFAFYGCEKLTSITLPDGLTSIDSSAFARTSLTSITIPSTVTDVAHSFCGKCETLTEIIMLPTNPPSCRGFNNVPSSVIMYVQDDSIEVYQSTTGWDDLNRYGVTIKGLSEREVA